MIVQATLSTATGEKERGLQSRLCPDQREPAGGPGPKSVLYGVVLGFLLAIATFNLLGAAQGTFESLPLDSDKLGKIRSWIDGGQFERAEQLLKEKLRQKGDRFSAYYWLGYLEFRRGRTFASVRAYREAETLQPHSAEVHRLLAINYFLLNQRALFKLEIQHALSADPADEQSCYLAGRFAYEVENDFPSAVRYLSTAISLSDSDFKAHCYLGLSFKALNRREEARRELERACQLVKESRAKFELPFRNMAEICLEERQPGTALEYSQAAIAISPESVENYYLKGKALFEMGRTSEAIVSLKQSASLDPTYAPPHYLLGNIYSRIGERRLAQSAFAHFTKIQKEYGQD